MSALEAAVAGAGLSLLVFADWYNVPSMDAVGALGWEGGCLGREGGCLGREGGCLGWDGRWRRHPCLFRNKRHGAGGGL